MTIAEAAASALVARGLATGTRLGQLTFIFRDDLDVPAYVDRETRAIHLNVNASHEAAIRVIYACFDELVGGLPVQTGDGCDGVVHEVAAGAEGLSPVPEQRRPHLSLV